MGCLTLIDIKTGLQPIDHRDGEGTETRTDADGRARRKKSPVAVEQTLRPRLRLPFADMAEILSCAAFSVANQSNMRAGLHFDGDGQFNVMPRTRKICLQKNLCAVIINMDYCVFLTDMQYMQESI